MDWFSPPLHHHGLPQSVILEFTQTNSLRPNLYVGPASRGPKEFLRAGSDLGASERMMPYVCDALHLILLSHCLLNECKYNVYYCS